jgi:hypothetical protein
MDNKKLNIGIILGSNLESGGGFQYESRIIDILTKYNSEKHNFYFFSFNKNTISDYKDNGVKIQYIHENKCSKIYRHLLRTRVFFKIIRGLKLSFSKIEKTLIEKYYIDLVYFLSPSSYAIDLINIPYIITVWDLCHRDYNEFPEVRDYKYFEDKEYFFNTALKKAIGMTTDSELGKNNVCRRYGIDNNRVHVLKFLPRIDKEDVYPKINITEKYNLSNDYVFYPAQFWAHKNHIYILKAIKILKEKYSIIIDAVFTGANKGNLDYILKKAVDYNIKNQIHYIGFVPDNDISALYRNAVALTIPTFFGPTNIPPLEAFTYNCPVCCSDLDGLRDQVKDAAFLMDLNNPESLANHLITIRNNEIVVNEKLRRGNEILKSWTEDDCILKLDTLFNEYNRIRECWG